MSIRINFPSEPLFQHGGISGASEVFNRIGSSCYIAFAERWKPFSGVIKPALRTVADRLTWKLYAKAPAELILKDFKVGANSKELINTARKIAQNRDEKPLIQDYYTSSLFKSRLVGGGSLIRICASQLKLKIITPEQFQNWVKKLFDHIEMFEKNNTNFDYDIAFMMTTRDTINAYLRQFDPQRKS